MNDNLIPNENSTQSEAEFIEDQEVFSAKKGLYRTILKFLRSIVISDKKVGELNGSWAALFKIVLMLCILLIPTFLGWATWVTNRAWAAEQHIVNTSEDERRIGDLELNVEKHNILLLSIDKSLTEISHKIEMLPPADWRRRIEILESTSNSLSSVTLNNDKANAIDHAKILVLLEAIKVRIELQEKNRN